MVSHTSPRRAQAALKSIFKAALWSQVVRVEQPDGTARYEKKQIGFSSGQDENVVISPNPSGLTLEEITQLQNLAGAFAQFGNRINVQPSIRFAPVISVGALLTILCQGPFYLKLIQLF